MIYGSAGMYNMRPNATTKILKSFNILDSCFWKIYFYLELKQSSLLALTIFPRKGAMKFSKPSIKPSFVV